MEQQWNDIDRGKLTVLEKTMSQHHFVTTLPPKTPHGLPWTRTQFSEVRK
jgi:hypothetical protein